MKNRHAGGLRVVLGLLVLFLLRFATRSLRLEDVAAAFRGLRGWQLLLLAILNGSIIAGGTARWWLVLRGQGFTLPFHRLVMHRLAGFGVSFFTPGPLVGGEPAQVLLCSRDGVPRAAAIAAVSLEKSVELLINFGFLLTAALFLLGDGGARRGSTAALAAALFLLPAAYLLQLWRQRQPLTWLLAPALPGATRRQSHWFTRFYAALSMVEAEMNQFCRHAPRAFAAALGVTILTWLLLMGEFWLLLRFLGAPLTPAQLLGVLFAARLAILLPLPGGAGSLEAAQVLMLARLGYPAGLAVSSLLLIRVRDITLALCGLWWARRLLPSPAASKE